MCFYDMKHTLSDFINPRKLGIYKMRPKGKPRVPTWKLHHAPVKHACIIGKIRAKSTS